MTELPHPLGLTSPPGPLSTLWRGGTCEKGLEKSGQAFATDVVIADAQHPYARLLEGASSRRVTFRLLRPLVNAAVDLQHESRFGAVEVRDESVDDVLAAELEAEAAAAPEQAPGVSFRRRRRLPHLPRPVVLGRLASVHSTSGHRSVTLQIRPGGWGSSMPQAVHIRRARRARSPSPHHGEGARG